MQLSQERWPAAMAVCLAGCKKFLSTTSDATGLEPEPSRDLAKMYSNFFAYFCTLSYHRN